jgi:hypothetical protein
MLNTVENLNSHTKDVNLYNENKFQFVVLLNVLSFCCVCRGKMLLPSSVTHYAGGTSRLLKIRLVLPLQEVPDVISMKLLLLR